MIFSPGDATPVDDYLKISGATQLPPRRVAAVLTVRCRNDRPNVWRFVQASLDDDSKVVGEKDYLGGTSRDDGRTSRTSSRWTTRSSRRRRSRSSSSATRARSPGSGAIVAQVVKGSPARPGTCKVGDVITAIDGQPVQVADEVGHDRAGAAGRHRRLVFTVTRDGQDADRARSRRVAAPSGDAAGQAVLRDRRRSPKDLKLDFPVEITIDPGAVSGPSAGLAFTLTIIDDLTPGNLTGGKKVAVTGTIDLDGNVGEVGGVPQKTAAALDAGAQALHRAARPRCKQARARAGRHEGRRRATPSTRRSRALREQRWRPGRSRSPPAAAADPRVRECTPMRWCAVIASIRWRDG